MPSWGAGLIQTARALYANDDFGVQLQESVYALDSTTIDLCLSFVFRGARFRRHKAAVKIHTLLDLRGNIPAIIRVSDGKMHDVKALAMLALEAGAIYLFDRAYIDYAQFQRITEAGAFFITRAKKNFAARRLYSQAVDKATGVRCDQTMMLSGAVASRDYPGRLRAHRPTSIWQQASAWNS